MPIPVMTVVAAVRNHRGLTARAAAAELGIAHGFLQQCEQFEYVPAPNYITTHNMALAETVGNFLAAPCSSLPPILSNVISPIILHTSFALICDATFHSLVTSSLFDEIFISVSGSTAYGPLFELLKKFFFVRDSTGIYLRATGDSTVDYFIDFIMNRFWSRKALQRRKQYTGFYYTSLYNGDEEYLGAFPNCRDEREILWRNPYYSARRSSLPHLLLYILTQSINLSFLRPRGRCPREVRETTIYEDLRMLLQEPVCPKQVCHSITFLAPRRHEVIFRWRSYLDYCVSVKRLEGS